MNRDLLATSLAWAPATVAGHQPATVGHAERFDAVVVGAGPAGSMAARRLAREGRRVLLLEREPLPRQKACGGGLSPRSVSRLPFPIDDLPHQRVSRLAFRLRGTSQVDWELPQGTAFYMVMRSDLDHALARSAAGAGALLREGEEALALNSTPEGYLVRTTQRTYAAPYVVAADGATGPLRRLLGLGRPPDCGVAIECELAVAPAVYERYADTAVFDIEAIEGGYGWIFPKRDHLSVGLGTLGRPGQPLRPRLREFVVRRGLTTEAEAEHLTTVVHPLPLSRLGEPCRVGGVLLAGDSAGLADGLAGEGICYALSSGDLAGKAIAEALDGYEAALDRYEPDLDEHIRRDQAVSHTIHRIVHRFPGPCYRLLTSWREGRLVLTALMLDQTSFTESLRRLPALRRLAYD